MSHSTLLEINAVKKYFTVGKQTFVKAVDGVTFSLRKGQTLGLVGESGCGKSTIGRCILRLHGITGGKILFEDRNIDTYRHKERLNYCRNVQSVFQDPYGSLNPRMRIEEIIGEPVLVHRLMDTRSRRQHVEELIHIVGLKPDHLKRYPHEFSGGQRQRICIARALSLNPKLVVLDEPVSALDVSIRAQILNLLMDLQDRFGLTYLFISHDLSVVEHISEVVVVMYLGKIVEIAPCDRIFNQPLHPYTQGLLSAILSPEPGSAKTLSILEGDVTETWGLERGCLFRNRCFKAKDECAEAKPALFEVDPEHKVACFLYGVEDEDET